MSNFEQFHFKPYINEALAEKGFAQPTEVQERLIPLIAKGKNIIGQSQTGSGKTHTFLLPLFQKINAEKAEVQVVITAPSRELATQIYDAASQIAKFSDPEIRVTNFVGGTDKQRQLSRLKHQQPQIVVGTPGRILDMMNEQALKIHTAFAFVVDEADMTLDLGFLPDVDAIASAMPEDLKMHVFSATIPQKLQPFLKKYLSNPVIEEIPSETVIAPTIKNILVGTKGESKDTLVYNLLTMGNPYLALVFANTKKRAHELTKSLRSRGLKVAEIHGGIQPRERKRTMQQIQHLDYQYVVATDLAARGIDIPGVSLIINDGIPTELEFFIHRVGRTGRNGMSGTAITIYNPDEENRVQMVESMGVKFEPMTYAHGELKSGYDRRRRQKRAKTTAKLDPTMIGMVKKKKKRVKPGYKRQIKNNIARDAKYKKRVEERETLRAAKKAKKRSHGK